MSAREVYQGTPLLLTLGGSLLVVPAAALSSPSAFATVAAAGCVLLVTVVLCLTYLRQQRRALETLERMMERLDNDESDFTGSVDPNGGLTVTRRRRPSLGPRGPVGHLPRRT